MYIYSFPSTRVFFYLSLMPHVLGALAVGKDLINASDHSKTHRFYLFCKIFWGLSIRVQKHAHIFWGFYCTCLHTVKSEGGRCVNDTKKKELHQRISFFFHGNFTAYLRVMGLQQQFLGQAK